MVHTRVTVAGWSGCGYFQKAKTALLGVQALSSELSTEVIEKPDRDAYRTWWFEQRGAFGERAANHGSSPAVWLGEGDFLGGCDATLDWLKQNFMAGSAISRPPRVTHDNDAGNGRGDYQFDAIVIGGGSGGLAFSKEAASQGAKVCVLDFVKPSWQGTVWGLGGTCVNVGCIPKKLMHQAALLGESLEDARSFGWELPAGKPAFSWEKLVAGVQDHISSLNFGYRVSLREAGVDYRNVLGSFKDAHTIETVDKKGKKVDITARRILIAVGGRPKPLDIPGGEHAISSDDLFSLERAPGKTLVIGASYVALECAGFLTGLGFDATVMVRSILLRGFDQQMADKIGEAMEHHGTKFIRPATPTQIVKGEDGRLTVTWLNAETGGTHSDVFDSVFVATGRNADTTKLNLGAAGVKAEADGKLACNGEQTNVPHIYAIGDVLSGRPELTPVAIAAGRLLARRLYGNATEGMDYDRIPTTVFTPLEYGACGLSEEDAAARYGGLGEGIEVYHSTFSPLEWAVPEHRHDVQCYVKVIVAVKDGNRVVGFHVLGPNAGEITQGWAAALRLGATFESFSTTIGIHPTMSEEFTTLSVTKSSGASAEKGGC